MTTNLKILYPFNYPTGFDTSLCVPTAPDAGVWDNLLFSDTMRVVYEEGSSDIDLILDYGATGNAAPTYVGLVGIESAQRSDSDEAIDVVISNTDDSTFTTGVLSHTETIARADLFGSTEFKHRATNYVFAPTGLNATQRYVRVRFTFDSVTSIRFHLKKLFIGSWFDFGKEPLLPITIEKIDRRGSFLRPRLTLTLNYAGLPTSTVDSFYSEIVEQMNLSPVLLYDEAGALLSESRAVMCRILSVRPTYRANDEYDMGITFEEMI